MKLVIIIGCWFCCLANLNAQENSIVFTYDEAGNMIERKIQVVMNGRIGKIDTKKDSIKPPIDFKIFPNPTNTYLNIEGDLPSDIKEAKINLLGLNGVVLKTDVYMGVLKTMNVSDLKNGLYLLEIKYSEKERSTYKIIISN